MAETYLTDIVPQVVEEIPPRAALVITDAASLEERLTAWSEQRKMLTWFIKRHLVEGVDYGKIHIKKDCPTRYACTIPSHFSKDCLFKAGSEKFVGLLRLKPVFRKDEDTWEMLGRPAGVICLVCTLVTVSGEVVGEGRGIRDIQKDNGDANKSVKMAAKSAQLDAILRTGCLSDVFTLDVDDWPAEEKQAVLTTTANGAFPVVDAPPKKTDTRQSIWRETLRVQLPVLQADWSELPPKSADVLRKLVEAITAATNDPFYPESAGLSLADAALQWVDKLEERAQGPGPIGMSMEPGDL